MINISAVSGLSCDKCLRQGKEHVLFKALNAETEGLLSGPVLRDTARLF